MSLWERRENYLKKYFPDSRFNVDTMFTTSATNKVYFFAENVTIITTLTRVIQILLNE
jgi:hypothetical protein|tara:strand:- start:23 stop:196 length:174 start_codon:yes stop_codon:yes gene_type:complete